MEINDIVTLQITDIAADGRGIGHAENMAVFVSGALPGDLARARITARKKRILEAEVLEIPEPSPDRREAYCPHAAECGGCPLSGLSYEAQLRWKERQVREKLVRLGGVVDPKVLPILAFDGELDDAGRPVAYRNKAVLAVGKDKAGRPAVGFRAAKSHRVIDVEDCRLQAPPARAAASAIRALLLDGTLTVCDPRSGEGLLTGVTVKTAWETGEVMVVLHVNGIYKDQEAFSDAVDAETLAYALDDAIYDLAPEGEEPFYSLESIVVIPDPGQKSGKSRPRPFVLAGKRTIDDRLGGLAFEIGAESFYQVNPRQAEKLYDQALAYAAARETPEGEGEGETPVLLDLYCGVGTIGLIAAARGAGNVLGVESVREAVLDANRNAVINGIVNARYACGKAEEVLPSLLLESAETEEQKDIVNQGGYKRIQWDEDKPGLPVGAVILDPPRRGCDEALLQAVCETGTPRIVYVSCDPATMSRDVKYLCEHGYRFLEAVPCDMFPNTGHVETVVLMTRD